MVARWQVVLLCVTGVVTGSAVAQNKAACPLDFKQQTDSIHAFEPIASFLTREPRCANCHGGVNPFIDGTGPDPEDENVPASTSAHGGGRIQRQRDRAPDGTLLIENECADCHNNLAPRRDGSKSVWMTAPGFLSFVGKDAPTLCKQIKRSTQTAEHFVGHLEDDNGGNNFGGTAFKGDRGLDPDVYDTAPAPPSISHAALMGLGHDWINAMGGAFQGDETCGCELTLEGEFAQDGVTAVTGAAYGVGMNANYRITGRVLWAPKQDSPHDGTFGDMSSTILVPKDGEIAVQAVSAGKSIAGSCKVEGSKTFQIKGLPPEALQYLTLEIAADGRYRLMLGMISMYLQFQATQNCSIHAAPGFPMPVPGGGKQAVVVNDAGIVIGRQEGQITNDGVVGRTATPIVMGVHSFTGSWDFKAAH
ncbi:MAG TPA: hypothetical protein VL219_04350 [Steroidobacteraceae bacterium]|nr:hypothetical protein [Steroidobacteraceae bacterium]